MNSNKVSNNLKASLFELTYIIDDYKRKNIMDMLCVRIKKAMNASSVQFSMYNKWQLDQPISHYACTYPVSSFKKVSIHTFMSYFNKFPDVSREKEQNELVEHKSNQTKMILKIHCQDNFYGFIVVDFSEDRVITTASLEKSRIVVEQFLRILYSNRHHKFLHDRNHLLFQLSTRLHSVHRTSEVLERVYRTISLLYPSFRYYLLMSQEFESGSLPIKMIEYTDDTTLSPEILAFINNKIQIEYLEEKDETHLFSPLSGDQGVYGVLQVEIPQLITISDEELNFVKRFTNMVGRAIERTTLYQSSNQLVADLQMINNSSRELNVNLEQHDITETVKRHIFDS